MRHLKTVIYHLLLEEPQTGYSLAKNIEQRTGWKPSWGSIYPQLDALLEQKLISVQEEGRTKKYSLTTKGKTEAKTHVQETTKILQEITQRMHVLSQFSDIPMQIPIEYLEELQQGTDPFAPVNKETITMKKEFFRLWKEELIEKNSTQINNILKVANKQLKEIKK